MANNLFLILSTLCFKVLVFGRLIIAQHSCHEDLSCFGDVISTTSTVQCYGYLSCSTASIVSSGSVFCDGSYSCFEAIQVQVTYTSSELHCRGLYSCALTSLWSAGVVLCIAEGSCYGSTIDETDYVLCYGAKSCSQTTIYVGFSVYGYGYASLQNCKMFSNATTTNYYFRAGESTDGATITCNSGHTCNIRCSSNACNNLTLTGEGTFSVDCYDALKSDACPDGHVLASFITNPLPNLSNLTLSPINNSYLYQNCDYQCKDYRECQNSVPNVTDICCTGSYSCGSLQLKKHILSTARCDSYYACSKSRFRFLNESDVYATGSFASWNSSVYNGKNMFCTGFGDFKVADTQQ